MTYRLPIILLFLLIPATAGAQQRESVSQVVTFGVKITAAPQRTAQPGIAEREVAQIGILNGSRVEGINQHAMQSEGVPMMSVQEKTIPRRQPSPKQSSPSAKVMTITD